MQPPSPAAARIAIAGEPPDSTWPCPATLASRLAFVTWPLDPLESRVPDDVAEGLASALCAAADVLYLGSVRPAAGRAWMHESEDCWTCRIRLPFSLWAPARTVELTYTRSPRRVRAMFEMPYFSWSMRGQTAWLFPHAPSPPPIDPGELDGALSGREPFALPFGAFGRFNPGTDGDFAELFARDARTQSALVKALAIQRET